MSSLKTQIAKQKAQERKAAAADKKPASSKLAKTAQSSHPQGKPSGKR
jgi:hypothetical protein